MEVKKPGKYKTKSGRVVEIYGFDDLATGGKLLAEGFFEDTRVMAWWNPETGAREIQGNGQDDIIEAIE